MSALDDILASLPIDELAGRFDVSSDQVRAAASAAIPALLGGLDANAKDASGAASIAAALTQHTDDLAAGGTVNLDRVDEADGAKITQHIFGDKRNDVAQALGGVGGVGGSGADGGLAGKLMPVLAPIVLAYLAKQAFGGSSGGIKLPTGAGGDEGIGSVLGDVLGGMLGGGRAAPTSSRGAGSIITDVLGGLLGGGRR